MTRPDTPSWPEASFDLRNVGAHPDHWYPVAWSREVEPGQTYAARFAGEPIVLVRPRIGPVFALEDRCAHRQVPLSKGTVDGCTIRCCYHGWRYDASGACVDVPYLGKAKLPNGVRRYPCFERDGLDLRVAGRIPCRCPAGADRRSGRHSLSRRGDSASTSPATTVSCTRT